MLGKMNEGLISKKEENYEGATGGLYSKVVPGAKRRHHPEMNSKQTLKNEERETMRQSMSGEE